MVLANAALVLCFARRGRSTGAGPAYMGLEDRVVSRGAPLQGEAVHIPFCLHILISVVWSIDLEDSNLSTHYPILFYSFWSLTCPGVLINTFLTIIFVTACLILEFKNFDSIF